MIFKPPVKFESSRSQVKLIDQWKCFGCCHVRTATIIIGLWHMAIHIVGLLLFIVAHYIVPAYYCDSSAWSIFPNVREKNSEFEIQKVKIDDIEPYSSSITSFGNGQGGKMWLLMSVISFFATVLLIGGAIKKKSLFILPFFVLQIFDLVFDLTILAVYVAMSSSFSEFFAELYNPPFQQFLFNFGLYQKILFTVIYILLALFIKIYLMFIVYFCYRFLVNQNKIEYNHDSTSHIHQRASLLTK